MADHFCENGCGKRVSSNKKFCMNCVEDMPKVAAQQERELLKDSTHVIVVHKSRDQEDLYRADGMLVASRQKDVVRFGHDIATAQSRLFRNVETSKKWLRRMADIDIAAESVGKPVHELVYGYAQIPVAAVVEEVDLEKEVNLTIMGDLTGLRRN